MGLESTGTRRNRGRQVCWELTIPAEERNAQSMKSLGLSECRPLLQSLPANSASEN